LGEHPKKGNNRQEICPSGTVAIGIRVGDHMVLRFIAFAEDAVESSAEVPEPYYPSQAQDVFAKHTFVNCPVPADLYQPGSVRKRWSSSPSQL
jgi:hypothetical protein